jgi:hypothetical protein
MISSPEISPTGPDLRPQPRSRKQKYQSRSNTYLRRGQQQYRQTARLVSKVRLSLAQGVRLEQSL